MSSAAETVTVLAAGAELEVRHERKDELWLTADELRTVTGWELKPEGLCKDEVCVPVTEQSDFREGGRIGASRLWARLGRPVLHDARLSAWMLGEAAEDRARSLATLEAPDFTLPDVNGQMHSLSDQRGKKVLLATWASW